MEKVIDIVAIFVLLISLYFFVISIIGGNGGVTLLLSLYGILHSLIGMGVSDLLKRTKNLGTKINL